MKFDDLADLQKADVQAKENEVEIQKKASLHLRFRSEKTWRRSTCCSSGTSGSALCGVDWPTTREFVILVPDPIISAPWSVLPDRGEPYNSRHATRSRSPRACKSDVYQPIARRDSPTPRCGVVSPLSHAPSQAHRDGDLVDTKRYVTSVKAAERRRRQSHKRCALWSFRKTLLARFSFFCDPCHGKVSPQLLNGNDGADLCDEFR